MLINPGHNQYTYVNKVAEIKFWLQIMVINNSLLAVPRSKETNINCRKKEANNGFPMEVWCFVDPSYNPSLLRLLTSWLDNNFTLFPLLLIAYMTH